MEEMEVFKRHICYAKDDGNIGFSLPGTSLLTVDVKRPATESVILLS